MSGISKIKKRDGSVVDFEKSKVENAIFKAARAVGGKDRKEAKNLADNVIKEVEKLNKEIPSVEEIQDSVEKVLIEKGHAKTAKVYIVYRQERSELRKQKTLVLEKDTLDEIDKKFDLNALRVLK